MFTFKALLGLKLLVMQWIIFRENEFWKIHVKKNQIDVIYSLR